MSKEKDHIWKRIIGKFFNKFTEFFLPDLHKDIDFTHKPKFLDNQLLKIVQKSGGKDRESDKLVEVKLKDGSNRFILIHVEVQDSRKPDFNFRMYQYQYRIFDKFNKKVVALAIYTDSNSKFKPNEYSDEFYGTEINYKFNTSIP
ncbi:MAG: Rpn family recombination-promoting nuclease/putative transposase [Candidatus Sericytochromatia bacterium]